MTKFWQRLTTVGAKAGEYSRECYFREAWADVDACSGARGAALLQRLAVVMFKPEALAGRRVEVAMDFMREHDFRLVAFRRVRLDRNSIRAIWRFQWNKATVDRMQVADLLAARCDALWVAFWDCSDTPSVPATVRLRALKGSNWPPARTGGQLRDLLGGTNRMVTFVHAVDEPVDIVREMGILFDSDERRELIGELCSTHSLDASDRLRQTLSEMYADIPGIEFDAGARLLGLESLLIGSDAHRTRGQDLLRAAIRDVQGGGFLDWRGFLAGLRMAGIHLPDWDLVQIGAEYIRHDLDGVVCTIDEDGRAGWLAGAGELVPFVVDDAHPPTRTPPSYAFEGVSRP